MADEDRESRSIENVEQEQFERELSKRYRTYMSDINGMQIDSSDLIGDSTDFDTISISLDLLGEDRVIYHPLTLTFSTLQTVQDGERFDLVSSFTSTQTAPLWQSYTYKLEAKSSITTSFGTADLLETDDLSYSHSRYPWGELIKVEGTSISLDEEFSFYIQPSKGLISTPMPLTIITLIIISFGLIISLSMTKNKHRRFLMLELVLLPIVALIYFFSYPELFVIGSSAVASGLWLLTALVSPKRLQLNAVDEKPEITVDVPVVGCPACDTKIPVTSDERPLKIACSGCGKTIKIVG